MKPAAFILVSPGPIDGYPPVQYQARLLADAGYPVTLITMPLEVGASTPHFSHPGVDVRCLSSASAFGATIMRASQFARALWNARRSLPHETVEIAYDPIGIFYSDFMINRPRWRISHLHELLQRHESAFIEKRLRTALHRYDLVVVPDVARGVHTQTALDIKHVPMVVENYPLRAIAPPSAPAGTRSQRFEVVYCGVLGLNQKLDAVVRSILNWPTNADLVLIGNDRTPTAVGLRRLAEQLGIIRRVKFLGWMNTPDAEARLSQSDLGVAFLDSGSEQLRTALTASNKRFQYMKAGIPQLGDTNPGVPGLLDGIGSCIGSDHDPEEIASLVTAYANDAERCAAEGKRAFVRHLERYNYETAFQPVLDLVTTW